MRSAIFNVLAFLAVFGPAYMLLLLGLKRLSRGAASDAMPSRLVRETEHATDVSKDIEVAASKTRRARGT